MKRNGVKKGERDRERMNFQSKCLLLNWGRDYMSVCPIIFFVPFSRFEIFHNSKKI